MKGGAAMASRDEIRGEQLRLKASGHYSGRVDGVDGPETRAAREAYGRDAAAAAGKKAESDARAAEATAKGAEAQAKAAQAEVDRITAQAKADREKRAAETAGVDRVTQIGMNVGAAAAGTVIGHKVASGIETRHLVTSAARNAEIAKVGTDVNKVLAAGIATGKKGEGALRKLQGAVAAADKLGLGKVRGPMGLPMAGILIAEAALMRGVVAPAFENQTAKEAVNAVGTLGMFGATALLGQRAIQNATPQSLPNAKALTAIETARAIVKNPASVTAEKPKIKTPKVPKAAPAAPGAMGTMASAAGKAVKAVGKGALRVLMPVAAFAAAASAFRSSAQAGEAKTISGLKGVIAGVDAVATGGLISDKLNDPAANAQMLKTYQEGKIYNRANRDGTKGAGTDGPALTTNDKISNLAKSGFTAAVGAMVAADARKDLIAQKAAKAAGNASPIAERVVARGTRGLGLLAKYGGGAAAIVTAADIMTSGAKADDDGPKAYLNAGAERKAQSAAAMPAAPLRLQSTPLRSDGETAGYTRIDPRTGQTVQVKAYATPKR